METKTFKRILERQEKVYELYHYQLYKDQVIFVKNINEMIQKIQYYLSHSSSLRSL